jgi:hypothetical protein
MRARNPKSPDPRALVSKLIDTGNVDTVYRDVYLQRARTLLGGAISVEEFRRIEQQAAELTTLPLMIGRALEKADWPRVKELGERGDELRQAVQGGAPTSRRLAASTPSPTFGSTRSLRDCSRSSALARRSGWGSGPRR